MLLIQKKGPTVLDEALLMASLMALVRLDKEKMLKNRKTKYKHSRKSNR
jgi:hypothetical protein